MSFYCEKEKFSASGLTSGLTIINHDYPQDHTYWLLTVYLTRINQKGE